MSIERHERSVTPNGAELVVAQGADRAGWLRANDRSMVIRLLLRGLDPKAHARWMDAMEGTGAARIEVALRYADGQPIVAGKKGRPQRVRLVKLHAGINCPADDVAMLWTHTLTLECRDGERRLIEDPTASPIADFFRVTAGPVGPSGTSEVRIEFKLGTNVTSRQHSGRRFRFVASAWCGEDLPIVARSADFDLVSRHPGCGQPALSGARLLLMAAKNDPAKRPRGRPPSRKADKTARRSVERFTKRSNRSTERSTKRLAGRPLVESLDRPFKRPRAIRALPLLSQPLVPEVDPLDPPVDPIDPNELIDIDQFLSWFIKG
jgi:hypothetical protein